MATVAERDLFASRVLVDVARAAPRLPRENVAGFLATRGHAYQRGLMIVGRATNGWDTGGWREGISSYELEHAAAAYAEDVLQRALGDGECPLAWVAHNWAAPTPEHNIKQSAFWRVVRRVVAALDLADVAAPSWPSRLVWSNLYKVAPWRGGNPGAALLHAQERGCVALHHMELETYRPSCLLFLAGSGWAKPFLPPLASGSLRRRSRNVEDSGTFALRDGTAVEYVVATHPQGKGDARWADDVIDAFEAPFDDHTASNV